MSLNHHIDSNTCLDWRGKPIIPFKYYVAKSDAHCSGLNTFHCYTELPIELQLRVLGFCDAPSLFRLMHTCSATRIEAKKLFWSQGDTWYRCESSWLTRMGGMPGPSVSCTKFSRHVQQLDVLFTTLWDDFEGPEMSPRTRKASLPAYYALWQSMTPADKMNAFWITLNQRFPSVRRVVLSDHFPINQPGNYRFPQNPKYAALVRACPPEFSIEVFLCLTDWANFHFDDEDRLYQLGNSSEVSWELVDGNFTRNIVSSGLKHCAGPIGAFQKLNFIKRQLRDEAGGMRKIMMDKWIKYELPSSHRAYSCPLETCHTVSPTLKAWETHVLTERHDIIGVSLSRNVEYRLSPTLPPEVLAAHTSKVEALDCAWTELEEQFGRQRLIWGEPGSSKRRQYEMTFLAQLELDPDWEQPEPKKCFIWRTLQEVMDISPQDFTRWH
jgi:hypothetical protein